MPIAASCSVCHIKHNFSCRGLLFHYFVGHFLENGLSGRKSVLPGNIVSIFITLTWWSFHLPRKLFNNELWKWLYYVWNLQESELQSSQSILHTVMSACHISKVSCDEKTKYTFTKIMWNKVSSDKIQIKFYLNHL